MTKQNSQTREILLSQIRQDAQIDSVLSKTRGVLSETEFLKPLRSLVDRITDISISSPASGVVVPPTLDTLRSHLSWIGLQNSSWSRTVSKFRPDTSSARSP